MIVGVGWGGHMVERNIPSRAFQICMKAQRKQKCGIFQTVRSLKERVKKGEAGEGGRNQILRIERQPLKDFKQEAEG